MVEFKSNPNKDNDMSFFMGLFKKLLIVVTVSGILMIIISIILLVVASEEIDRVSAGFIIGLGAICPLITYIIYIILRKKVMPRLNNEAEEIYTFDEQYITIYRKSGDGFEVKTRARYSDVSRAVESGTFYILHIAGAKCCIIDKAWLTKGSIMELNSYLSQNLGRKYKGR